VIAGTGFGSGRRNPRLTDQSAAVQMPGARGEEERGNERTRAPTERSLTTLL
jgi:hypothetical protein